MRLAIYSLLSGEGSSRSQKVLEYSIPWQYPKQSILVLGRIVVLQTSYMIPTMQVLIDSLKHMPDEKERNTVITFIAFVENPTPEFVSQFEALIDPDVESTDPQLLAYGALASSATPALQQRIVQFLQSRLIAAENNFITAVHLIHALGNTGCNTTVSILIGYLNYSDVNIQLAAINAMRKHTNNKLVHDAFISMLNQSNLTEQQIRAIITTLISGLEHQYQEGLEKADNMLLFTVLVSAVMKHDSLELHQLLTRFALKLDTDETNEYLNILYTSITEADIKKSHSIETHDRVKRSFTTNWAHSDPLYGLISSHSTRVSDVTTYPHHKAYLWGKDFGVSKLNAKFAAGVFVGVNIGGSRFKLFAKAVAKGHAFGHTVTALQAELLVQKDYNNWRGKIYLQVGGSVLLNFDQQRYARWTNDWPLYSSRYRILHFEFPIFIFVGFLRFSCDLYAQLAVTAHVDLTASYPSSSASTDIVPRATVTASAAATASLLVRTYNWLPYNANITVSVHLSFPGIGSRRDSS